MKKAIRDHWKDFAAIIALLVVSLGVGSVILSNQRFRFPFTAAPVEMYADLASAQGITPGQGQAVVVSGIQIGRIQGVTLVNGNARARLAIFPKYKDLLHTDASGLIRPRTGLQDLFLEVNPGSPKSPVARKGFIMPVSRTLREINLDEVLASLDQDTRDHLQLLLSGAAGGLKGRGMDLAELFKRFGPTARDLRRVNESVALERSNLKDSIHGLAQLSSELAGKDDDLARLVDASAAVFGAFASEDRNVSLTVHKLPGALRTTTQALADVQRFAQQLGPAATSLTPVFTQLDRTNRTVTPIARRLTPVVRDQIRPFVREAQPLVANLRPAATGLGKATPNLTTVFLRLNHLFNLLGYNPNGREPADKADRQEGYLFWLAWVTHQTENLINTDDANGPMRPVFLTGSCSTLINLINGQPPLEFLMGLSPLLQGACGNPATRSVQPELVKKTLAAARKRQEAAG